jgi:hypothetical protein
VSRLGATEPGFRQANVLGNLLRESEELVRVRLPDDTARRFRLFAAQEERCARVGVSAALERDEDGSWLTLRACHDRIDAFGLVYLLLECLRGEAPSVDALAPGGRCRGVLGAYAWVHHVQRAAPPAQRRTTLTQRLLALLIERLGLADGERIALAVALGDAASLSPDAVGGNGFVLVELEARLLRELAGADKASWRRELVARAERVCAVAARKASLMRSHAVARISSLGDLARLPWTVDCAWLDPARFQMVSTPGAEGTTNLFLWSTGKSQALALCGRPDHPLMRAEREVVAAWTECLR